MKTEKSFLPWIYAVAGFVIGLGIAFKFLAIGFDPMDLLKVAGVLMAGGIALLALAAVGALLGFLILSCVEMRAKWSNDQKTLEKINRIVS